MASLTFGGNGILHEERLEKSEGAIKNEQSRNTDSIVHTIHRTSMIAVDGGGVTIVEL
jgi:hypothetical protein